MGSKSQHWERLHLTLCYSAAEYACPVWSRSSHAKYLDPALNDSCCIITGCLKPTNTNCLYLLAGIAPPDIRRELISRRERYKAMHDPSHMLYGSQAANQRLKSRKRSFLYSTPPLTRPSEETRLDLWKDQLRVSPPETSPKYWASWSNCLWSPDFLGILEISQPTLHWNCQKQKYTCSVGPLQWPDYV